MKEIKNVDFINQLMWMYHKCREWIYFSRHWAASRTLVSLNKVPVQNMEPSLFFRATWISNWFQDVSKCKTHHERPRAFIGINSACDPFGYRGPCCGHGGRSPAALAHLFDGQQTVEEFFVFDIGRCFGWGISRTTRTTIRTRISVWIGPSTGSLLLQVTQRKHSFNPIDKWTTKLMKKTITV